MRSSLTLQQKVLHSRIGQGRTLNLPTTPLQIITDPNECQKLVEHEYCEFGMDMVFPEYNSTSGFRGCYKDFDCSVPEGMDPCMYAQEPRHLASYYTCNYPKWK